jgi:hypothetical protein
MDLIDLNEDGDITMSEIYETILSLMKEQVKLNINGNDKKDNVLTTLRLILPTDIYKQYEFMISKAIDFIFLIANNKKMLNELSKKYCKCLPC